MSLLIGDNLVVSMHYTLTDDAGNVIDNSEGMDALTYLHGAGNIIPGLEKALVGKIEKDSVQVRIDPADAYGEEIPELIETIDKAAFQGVKTVEAGMSFEAKDPNGAIQQIVVK